MSPALAGGFLTTEPPGKPWNDFLMLLKRPQPPMENAGKGMNHFPALGGLPQLHTEGQSGSRWTSHFVHMETSGPVPSSKAVWQFHCPGGAGLVSVAFAAWQMGLQVNPMWWVAPVPCAVSCCLGAWDAV